VGVNDAAEGLVPDRLPIPQAPPGQLPALTWLVLQITARTESPGSVHDVLNVVALPAVIGSGESETDETVGARFCTVNVPESEEEQDPAASQAKA
jgi:hypothetical protein